MTNLTKYDPEFDKVTRYETTGVKLRNADNRTIKVMVVKIMVMFGFGATAIPTDNNDIGLPRATYLFDLIRETLGEWTDEEVVYAMKLAATKVINANTKLYDGQLGISFFGDVMSSYRQFKREQKQAVQYILPEELTEISEDEKKTIIINSFLEHFKAYQQTKQLIDLGGINFSFANKNDLFTKFGVIDQPEQPFQAEEIYKNRQQTALNKTLSWSMKDAIRFSIENINKESGDFIRIEQELKLKRLYQYWIDNNTSIEQIIKSIKQ